MKKTIVLSLFVFLLGNNLLSQATFQGLGDLPGDIFASTADGISPDGMVVVGTSISASGLEAYYWTAHSGMIGIGDLPGDEFFSVGEDAAANGDIIVGQSQSSLGFEPFIYHVSNNTMTGLGDLPNGSALSNRDVSVTNGMDISDDGSVVVGTIGANDSLFQAFRWTATEGMEGLGFLPGGSYSRATATSFDGSIVAGHSESANGVEGFRWTAANGMQALPGLPGALFARSLPCNMSILGHIVGGSTSANSGSNYEAVIWPAGGGIIPLGDLPGGDFLSIANSSSDNGVIVGESSTGVFAGNSIFGLDYEAFVWTEETGMQKLKDVLVNNHGLDLTGWTLTRPIEISADGNTIVGWGVNPDGFDEGWIITNFDLSLLSNVKQTNSTASSKFALSQNHPNPFDTETTIEYELPKTANVILEVYNVFGNSVQILVNGRQAEGRYAITWDGLDIVGKRVESGIYIFQIKAGDFIASRKMLIH